MDIPIYEIILLICQPIFQINKKNRIKWIKKKGSHLSEKAQKDYELVIEPPKKDQQAFAELMDKYKDSIYYMLLKMVNNNDDAEDLTLEAFGKAFNRLHQYTPNFAFSTWLFKIATNNCIDFLRKKKKM